MNTPNFILSPCGTSLLTNKAGQEIRSLISTYANSSSPDDIPENARKKLYERISEIRNVLGKAEISKIKRMSAELNGILSYYNNSVAQTSQDQHYLLCTDTWLGEETANLVSECLKQQGFQVQIYKQKDLKTLDLDSFQLALSEFVKEFSSVIDGYRSNNYHIVFNLTGGFKSVQGFLQTMAMFYADEAIYIFETGGELLRIPKLPIRLAADDIIKEYFKTIRRLANNLDVEEDDITGIPETFLLQVEDEITLSPWGQVVWEKEKKGLYQQKVWPSPSGKVRYDTKFGKSISGLSPRRHSEINRKIDMLAQTLELDSKYNLSSLDFKELEGDPVPGSTHELDAWHDQDAKRIYGHFEKDVFVLDKLGKALH